MSAPNSPKKVLKLADGTFKAEKGNDLFNKSKREIRITFRASNGKQTITCVCFSKVACRLLNMEASKFVSLDEIEQRKVLKKLLYEEKFLTIKNQRNKEWDNYLLINVEEPEITK